MLDSDQKPRIKQNKSLHWNELEHSVKNRKNKQGGNSCHSQITQISIFFIKNNGASKPVISLK